MTGRWPAGCLFMAGSVSASDRVSPHAPRVRRRGQRPGLRGTGDRAHPGLGPRPSDHGSPTVTSWPRRRSSATAPGSMPSSTVTLPGRIPRGKKEPGKLSLCQFGASMAPVGGGHHAEGALEGRPGGEHEGGSLLRLRVPVVRGAFAWCVCGSHGRGPARGTGPGSVRGSGRQGRTEGAPRRLSTEGPLRAAVTPADRRRDGFVSRISRSPSTSGWRPRCRSRSGAGCRWPSCCR